MSTEPLDTCPQPEQILSPELVQELESVVEIVRSGIGAAAFCDEALALVRVLDNVPPEKWERFASTHGLEQWFGIPLKGTLADSVSVFLKAQERLAFQRDHDALTGIANRGFFNRKIEAEVERALRSHNELSLLYVDIDNFKRVNDTYGHGCGDEVLKRLARIMRDNVRHYDIVARLGGEEFCVILPATSCWTGVMLGNRLLEIFRQETFTCDGESFSLTFSGGVASLSQLDSERQNSTELLKCADQALYDAKSGGKNTIRLAESARLGKDKASLVQAQEKQFLFSFLGSE